ncbi:Vesicle transport v-SNARE 13 [Morus notabilis]|uniref:Vesicle transport v-SNARE 13 n=1 Tax=Morus notabilis TaxID=981085 RepID=W9QJB8_9ROSA|nr:Vesicle transport v-SNARE 13 [Morus notabilis]
MSEVFEGYEGQYCEISANLSRKCTAASALNGEQRKQRISEIKSGLDDADNLIKKMDLEARSLQPSLKARLLAKLREYKADLDNFKSEVKRISLPNANLTARDELFESGMAEGVSASGNQRDRLMMSTERLNQSSDRIKESRRTMLETEELGVSILHDLHQQRQSLLHAHKTYLDFCVVYSVRIIWRIALNLASRPLHGVDDNIIKSKKVLTAMSRRMSRNKWIIGSIIAALVLAILFIIYFKLTH